MNEQKCIITTEEQIKKGFPNQRVDDSTEKEVDERE